jgi:DNA repair exonuclease SbcCD ATPase subunit
VPRRGPQRCVPTHLSHRYCEIWKRQPTAYNTWPQFKLDFAVAYQEYSEALDITPAASGFHTEAATDQQETIEAIANLATATAEDRKAVANLTGTNATLTKEHATTNGKLVAALMLVTTLTKQNADLRAGKGHRSTENRTTERKHYCWTCGYRCEHSSWLCPNPATGNKTRAKASDTMNGSIKNKP